MATTHYHCEICGCLDLEDNFLKTGEYQCPDCGESDDVFPYRMFRCGKENHHPEPEQLVLFDDDKPKASDSVVPLKDGCGRVAEQVDFFEKGLSADFDPTEEELEYVCPNCGGTSYQQIAVEGIKRGNPVKIEARQKSADSA